MAQSLNRNLSGQALHTGSRWQCPNYWDKTVEPCHKTKQTKLLPLIQCANAPKNFAFKSLLCWSEVAM